MASPFGPLMLIADAASAFALPEIERSLGAQELQHRSAVAADSADAVRLARGAIAGGGRFVVAVGGDAIVHDVVNGMFATDHAEAPVLGVIPAGVDNEFFRQFGLPMDVERAASRLAGDAVYAIDVGVLRRDGDAEPAFVTNLVEAGLAARMAPWTSGGSRLRTFARFWGGVIAARASRVHVEAAHQAYAGPAWSIVVGNGRYGAGGFRVSPRS